MKLTHTVYALEIGRAHNKTEHCTAYALITTLALIVSGEFPLLNYNHSYLLQRKVVTQWCYWYGIELGITIAHLRFTDCGFTSRLGTTTQWPWTSYLHLCACHQAV